MAYSSCHNTSRKTLIGINNLNISNQKWQLDHNKRLTQLANKLRFHVKFNPISLSQLEGTQNFTL